MSGPRIYVPYVDGKLMLSTYVAVAKSGYPYQFVHIDSGDHGGYGRLIRRLWAEGRTFIVCEQDVVFTQQQINSIYTCGHQWCSFAYDNYVYPPGPYFGLVRFDAHLLSVHDRAAEVALYWQGGKEEEAGWWDLDSRMARDLTIRGATWAQHTPPVRHLHPGPASQPPSSTPCEGTPA